MRQVAALICASVLQVTLSLVGNDTPRSYVGTPSLRRTSPPCNSIRLRPETAHCTGLVSFPRKLYVEIWPFSVLQVRVGNVGRATLTYDGALGHQACLCSSRCFHWGCRYGGVVPTCQPATSTRECMGFMVNRLHGGGDSPHPARSDALEQNIDPQQCALKDSEGKETNRGLNVSAVPRTRDGVGAKHTAPLRVAPEAGDVIVGLTDSCHTSSLVEAVWDVCFGGSAVEDSTSDTEPGEGVSENEATHAQASGKRIYVRTGQQTWTGPLTIYPGLPFSRGAAGFCHNAFFRMLPGTSLCATYSHQPAICCPIHCRRPRPRHHT